MNKSIINNFDTNHCLALVMGTVCMVTRFPVCGFRCLVSIVIISYRVASFVRRTIFLVADQIISFIDSVFTRSCICCDCRS